MTPLRVRKEIGFADMVSEGLRTVISGVNPRNWFGPGQPLLPIAPPGTRTRVLDYNFATNIQIRPKAEEGVSFEQLRALADQYDLIRIIIETRKDQVVAVPQTFRLRRIPGETQKDTSQKTLADPRVKMLNDLFLFPDRERDWGTWIRACLEEVFVTDTLTLEPRWTRGKKIYGLDVLDGTTINRKIDETGRTPLPPSVAYQQVLKGMPAKDLTTRDIIYRPRNYRANRIYGYSPVEQIMMTINVGIRRQLSQLSYYTEGNVPETFAQVPDGWSKEQLQDLQEQFDILAGNIAQKSKIRFLPKLEGILFPKDKMLTDEFDPWLARIICFCFSISPQPFIKMMNRATAQVSQDQSTKEGLKPVLDFLSGVLTFFVNAHMNMPDIEHVFMNDEESDKLKKAQIDKIYASYGKQSVDEQRIRDGEDPIGLGYMFQTPKGPIPAAPFLTGGPMAEGLPEHVIPADEQAEHNMSMDDKSVENANKAPNSSGGEQNASEDDGEDQNSEL